MECNSRWLDQCQHFKTVGATKVIRLKTQGEYMTINGLDCAVLVARVTTRSKR